MAWSARTTYSALVLATGTRARRLPHLPDDLVNVAVLRTAADAQRLGALIDAAHHLTVLVGGFIGLEIAASARAADKSVTVLEAAPRLLTRSVFPELAGHVLQTHRASGIDLRLGVAATLLGRDEPYRAFPWFWSEQGAMRLQIAGSMPHGGVRHLRPDATPREPPDPALRGKPTGLG